MMSRTLVALQFLLIGLLVARMEGDRAGGRLVTHGPYRRVRHPMYLAVLVFTAAFALAGDAWQWLLWLALAAVLHAKARREERALLALHAGYAHYRARTRAILPFLL